MKPSYLVIGTILPCHNSYAQFGRAWPHPLPRRPAALLWHEGQRTAPGHRNFTFIRHSKAFLHWPTKFGVFLDVCLSIQVQYGHYGPLFFGVIRCTSPGPAVQDLLKLLPSASAHHYEPAHARKTPCSSGSSCRSIRHIDSKCQTESNQVNTREASFLAEWKSHICGNKDNPKPAGQDQNQPARVRRVTPANGMQLRNATSR